MSNLFFSLANPTRFRRITRPLFWAALIGTVILFTWGLYLALIGSPQDYLQKESVRIMYIHVPAAWLALGTYSSMGFAALFFLIWKHMLAGLYIRAVAPIGIAFTLICLITGSIWGYPTWGTWWVWDARLTSVLILFFLYAGIMALANAFTSRDKSLQAASWLTLIGVVNLPIIKFSVDWWNTLHQPASISSLARIAEPALHSAMMTPLLVMAGAYVCLFITLTLLRLENEIMACRADNSRMRQHYGS